MLQRLSSWFRRLVHDVMGCLRRRCRMLQSSQSINLPVILTAPSHHRTFIHCALAGAQHEFNLHQQRLIGELRKTVKNLRGKGEEMTKELKEENATLTGELRCPFRSCTGGGSYRSYVHDRGGDPTTTHGQQALPAWKRCHRSGNSTLCCQVRIKLH